MAQSASTFTYMSLLLAYELHGDRKGICHLSFHSISSTEWRMSSVWSMKERGRCNKGGPPGCVCSKLPSFIVKFPLSLEQKYSTQTQNNDKPWLIFPSQWKCNEGSVRSFLFWVQSWKKDLILMKSTCWRTHVFVIGLQRLVKGIWVWRREIWQNCK